MIKQDDIIQLQITALGTMGEGIGKYEDYTVFVKYALPGEVVLAKVNYVKRSVAYADIVAVECVSDSRVKPVCPHYGVCGGCQLQHMDYSSQLAYKGDKVASNLRKLGGIELPVSPCQPSMSQLAYRNKIALPVGGRVGKVVIGMYRNGSHDIVNIGKCYLVDSWANELVEIVTAWANEHKIVPYSQHDNRGQLRHVVARCVDNQVLVTLVVNGETIANYDNLISRLSEKYATFGLFINVNTAHNNVILGKTNKHIHGIRHISSSQYGVNYTLGADSFFQVNDDIKDKLYSRARQLIGSSCDSMIDCFSGVGLLSGAMYSDNYDMYAIEIDSNCVADANKLKGDNNLTKLTNICGDANVHLPQVLDKLRAKGHKVSLLVDPPRKGLGEQLCGSIINAHPDNIVYISCDSATLARDLKVLSSSYSVALVEPYDMFPNTNHVETLVLLQSK